MRTPSGMTIRKAVEANMAWSLTLFSYSERGWDMVSAGDGTRLRAQWWGKRGRMTSIRPPYNSFTARQNPGNGNDGKRRCAQSSAPEQPLMPPKITDGTLPDPQAIVVYGLDGARKDNEERRSRRAHHVEMRTWLSRIRTADKE
jgi:hypothetical protein